MSNSTFLLVHGGHHGEWVWAPLQNAMTERGLASRTVTLPSAVTDVDKGEPYPGMYDDAKVIRDAIAQIRGDVIVVAHSYAGVPVTEAVSRDSNVVHVVYVAAYMLDVGESMFGTHGVPSPESLSGLRPAANPDLNLPLAFYDGDPDNPDTARAIARLVPQSVRADFETVTRAGWRQVPNSYVIPTHDLSLTGTVAEQLAERADRVFRVPGNHAPFWSNVTEFADLLVKIDGLVHAAR
ncbi:alpha/beta fold hydrolase [Micromonospora musae]|uniref:Alpha/beta hydrolase n=1 Tax=Micromonospora musae TaxID=1894970 RepID=A0A3A9YII9_9ACTN|nr:alpha/beta fold hydrolase [Micromonospora musae]RKN32287.1 alpha/beta hydrolase [Micromonospora musae]